MVIPPLSFINWLPCWRIIPSRFPPVNLFDRVADPADLEAVIALESLTNDRLRDEVGDLSLIPPEDRVSGPGTSVIMAAFTHLHVGGSRFTRGHYGVFYAGKELTTSIAETKHHRAAFMRATQQPMMDLIMRAYAVDLRGDLHDVRNWINLSPGLFDPSDYTLAQELGDVLHQQKANGVVYKSVRDPKQGECAAVFRPPLLSNCRQTYHYCYHWDGKDISYIYECRAIT